MTLPEKFKITNKKTGKEEEKLRPKNYIKQYYIDNHTNTKDEDPNYEVMYCRIDECKEKHVQQELFCLNHYLEDGVFIYDLEFAQPSIKGLSINSNNKPDMLGIRYNKNGDVDALCMIEVKSTLSALGGNSGLKKHKDGMEAYLTKKREDKYLMNDRWEEAYEIMKQYSELGLYGVERIKESLRKEDFLASKDIEIIFIFTNKLSEDDNIRKSIKKELENCNYKEVLGLFDYGKETVQCDVYRKVFKHKN